MAQVWDNVEAKPDAPLARDSGPPTILIGTPSTIRLAARQLNLLPEIPEPIGCVLLQRDEQAPTCVNGLSVLGDVEGLAQVAEKSKPAVALVCLPSAMTSAIAQIRAALTTLGITERFLPPLGELIGREPPFVVGMAGPGASSGGWAGATSSQPTLDVGSLIGRPPHPIDRELVASTITGKRVLITGAGGSIGSQLCQIVADFKPARLIMMERAENPLFEIDRRMMRLAPDLDRRAVLGDVVDRQRTLRILRDAEPDVVLHAAAHKHVPLMEEHPAGAVVNNVFGTASIADAAADVGVERFVLISTDKAVNPRSVMGATKRLAERYVQTMPARAPQTHWSLVRFGNVLGSSCSVLAIWSAQLAEGGPVTVTDPAMTRFFMTIPEAASLVLQSAAIKPAHDAAGVFVLDMGCPISILDLARRFVRGHGFEPVVRGRQKGGAPESSLPGIEIVFTGVRPGEKLHEELASEGESLSPTGLPGIRQWNGSSADTPEQLDAALAALRSACESQSRDQVMGTLRRYVPELIARSLRPAA